VEQKFRKKYDTQYKIEIIKQTENNIMKLNDSCENDIRNRTISVSLIDYTTGIDSNCYDALFIEWMNTTK